jgi:hypothetical protein
MRWMAWMRKITRRGLITKIIALGVTLASQIPPEDRARLNLGYLDPASVSVAEWQNREQDGIL